jgi:hypothetical protein
MRIRAMVVAVVVAIVGMFPLSAPAQATHNCGFDPCPHPEDVLEILCEKYPILSKYINLCNLWP